MHIRVNIQPMFFAVAFGLVIGFATLLNATLGGVLLWVNGLFVGIMALVRNKFLPQMVRAVCLGILALAVASIAFVAPILILHRDQGPDWPFLRATLETIWSGGGFAIVLWAVLAGIVRRFKYRCDCMSSQGMGVAVSPPKQRLLLSASGSPRETFALELWARNPSDQSRDYLVLPLLDFKQTDFVDSNILRLHMPPGSELFIPGQIGLPDEPGVHELQFIYISDPYQSLDTVSDPFVQSIMRSAVLIEGDG
jgi:hypothetical protein